MNPVGNQPLEVDGFEIRWEPDGDEIRVVAVRDGEEAFIAVKADPAPQRERVENMAVAAWWALHNLRRRSVGEPREDREEEDWDR